MLSHGVTAPIVSASSLRLGVFRRKLVVEGWRERERWSVKRHLRVGSRSCRYGMGGTFVTGVLAIKSGFGGGLVLAFLLRSCMTGVYIRFFCGVMYFSTVFVLARVIGKYIVRYRLSSLCGEGMRKSKEGVHSLETVGSESRTAIVSVASCSNEKGFGDNETFVCTWLAYREDASLLFLFCFVLS